MNRAASWRLSTPAVRHDYAPRSWDTHPRFSDMGRRENFWPAVRRALKLATVTAAGFGILYSGLSFRVRYLGDGTIRFERKTDLLLATAGAPPALSMAGTVAAKQPAPLGGPGTAGAPSGRPAGADAAPPSVAQIEQETCQKNRQAIAAAVAEYNRKFPATQVHSLETLAQVDADLPELASCPSQGHYTLEFSGDEPVVRCSAHR